jgi:hypothetical protein
MSVVLVKSRPVQPSRFEYLGGSQRMRLEPDGAGWGVGFGAHLSLTYSVCTCDNKSESRASTFEAYCRKGLHKDS